jgi:hypothetical protein
MLGSLAGLLLMASFTPSENNGHDIYDRGLWHLSLTSYSEIMNSRCISQQNLLSNFVSMSSLPKVVFIFFIVAFTFFLFLFSAKPRPSRKTAAISLTSALQESPIEVRPTSIQTEWVLGHEILSELMALDLEAPKYVLRWVIG